MSQEGCGELRGTKIAGGLDSWNPILRKEREGWAPGAVDLETLRFNRFECKELTAA
jgi:hypothetical protein